MRYIFAFILFWNVALHAQDPFYSNYATNPIILNPAFTGLISNGNARAAVNYRDQWRSFLKRSAFKTTTLATDFGFCISEGVLAGDRWGIGAYISDDESGVFPLHRIEAMLTASYVKNLDGDKLHAAIGAEFGLINHRLGNKNLVFDEQFDDPTSPGELFDHYSFTMWGDVGVGLLLYLASETRTSFGFDLSGSVKHLGSPEYKFFNRQPTDAAKVNLNSRYTGKGNIMFPIVEERFGLALKGLYMFQKPYTQINVGPDLVFEIDSDYFVSVGGRFRRVQKLNDWHNDAIIVSAVAGLDRYLLGGSYDINVSSLINVSRSVGAFEFSLSCVLGKDKCSDLVKCPVY